MLWDVCALRSSADPSRDRARLWGVLSLELSLARHHLRRPPCSLTAAHPSRRVAFILRERERSRQGPQGPGEWLYSVLNCGAAFAAARACRMFSAAITPAHPHMYCVYCVH